MNDPYPLSTEELIFTEELLGQELIFHTAYGLFSPKQIDEGTKLLLGQLHIRLGDHNLDFGCGYGAIGLTMAKLASQGKTHLVDKDFVAVEFAKKNAHVNEIANAEVYLSNVFSHVTKVDFNTIVSNIPGGIGKEVLTTFFSQAPDHLRTGGAIYVVCISGLKEFVKSHLLANFHNCDKLAQGKTYTVYKAVKND